MTKLRFILPFLLLPFLSGCFHILHIINIKPNGNIKVYWQFDISNSLAKQNEKGKKKPGPKKKESISEKISKTQKELPLKLKGLVTDLQIKEIKDDFQVGMAISFKAKKYVNLPQEESFTLLPRYNAKGKYLTFPFEPSEKEKQKRKAAKTAKEPGNNNQPSPPQKKPGAQFENLIKSIFSSARYQLILGDGYHPVRALVKGKTTGKKYPVRITKLGKQNMLMIPFMSIMMNEKDGFDLVVYLK